MYAKYSEASCVVVNVLHSHLCHILLRFSHFTRVQVRGEKDLVTTLEISLSQLYA